MQRIRMTVSCLVVVILGIGGQGIAQASSTSVSGHSGTTTTLTACAAATPADQLALNAAKNEARQMAEFTNGGLIVYRAEPAMHGAAINSPCTMLGPDQWQFTIRGGEPTTVVVNDTYTTLSVVTVQGRGRDRTVTVNYNGPIEAYTGSVAPH